MEFIKINGIHKFSNKLVPRRFAAEYCALGNNSAFFKTQPKKYALPIGELESVCMHQIARYQSAFVQKK